MDVINTTEAWYSQLTKSPETKLIHPSNNKSATINLEHDTLYDVPVFLVVLLSIFYGIISVLAVVGNLLVMWIVATSRRMQNVTNCFIANLALADIIIGLFSIPFQFQAALLQRWDLPEFMCPFCPFVKVLSVSVSIFTLTAIAIDRHRAILDPLSARPSKLKAKVIIAGIWIVGVILAMPMAIVFSVEKVLDHSNKIKYFCHHFSMSDKSMFTYILVVFFLQYAIPLCVITFVYTRVALKLWGTQAPGNAQYTRDANLMKNKKKVIKMLFIVVALFALCWLPLQTYNLLQHMFPTINEYRYINIVFFCCDWLAMSNSCYNPFIYGIYNEKFKREFKLRFPGGRSTGQAPINDSYDMEKTQTLRFSTSCRFHGDCRHSHPNIQLPVESYTMHFCQHPRGRTRCNSVFVRTTRCSEPSELRSRKSMGRESIYGSNVDVRETTSVDGNHFKSKISNRGKSCQRNTKDINGRKKSVEFSVSFSKSDGGTSNVVGSRCVVVDPNSQSRCFN